MDDLAVQSLGLPAMSAAAVNKVLALQCSEAELPQVALETQHILHAGLYARTIRLPEGTAITAALTKIPMLVIVEGDAIVWLGAESCRLLGYNLLPASAGRKQVFFALTGTMITMVFPTEAQTVEEAEAEFTDEADLLASRRPGTPNEIIITGER